METVKGIKQPTCGRISLTNLKLLTPLELASADSPQILRKPTIVSLGGLSFVQPCLQGPPLVS